MPSAPSPSGPSAAPRLQNEDLRLLALLHVPHRGYRDQFALVIALDDFEDANWRQLALRLERLAVADDGAVRREIGEHGFQRHAIFALEAEGARDLALADLLGRAAEILKQLLARRHAAGRRVAARVRARLARSTGPIRRVAALLLFRHAGSFD